MVEETTRADEEYDGQEETVLAWHTIINEEAAQAAEEEAELRWQTAVNEEWERARVHRQIETAYNGLTRTVLLGSCEEGAMYQFLSYVVREIANDCYTTFRNFETWNPSRRVFAADSRRLWPR